MSLPTDNRTELIKHVTVFRDGPTDLPSMHNDFSQAVKQAQIHFLDGRELEVRNDSGDVVKCKVRRDKEGIVKVQPEGSSEDITVAVSRGNDSIRVYESLFVVTSSFSRPPCCFTIQQ
jgi:hypothetical protein